MKLKYPGNIIEKAALDPVYLEAGEIFRSLYGDMIEGDAGRGANG
jgi:hypothetical protein